VDNSLSCSSDMENLYYAENKCATVPKSADWPLVCYHCGSGEGVTVPKTEEEWAQVYPQCKSCLDDSTVEPAHSGKVKQCQAATTSKKRTADEAELVASQRKKQRKRAPDENQGEDGCAVSQCSLTVLSHCALSLCSLTVLSRCALSLGTLTVLSFSHCALPRCFLTVLSFTVLSLTVSSHCALSLCSFAVMSLCSHRALSQCALLSPMRTQVRMASMGWLEGRNKED
jgi:hypothetical protein